MKYLLFGALLLMLLPTVAAQDTPPLADYGDAPDSPQGASFPSLYDTDNARLDGFHGVFHRDSSQEWLGAAVSLESEPNLVNRDDYDDSFTATGVMVTLAAEAPPGPRYLNMLVDANRDLEWRDEWFVENKVVSLAAGTSTTVPLPELAGLPLQERWIRVTLTRSPIDATLYADVGGWDGSAPAAGFAFGETEDYYFAISDDDIPTPTYTPSYTPTYTPTPTGTRSPTATATITPSGSPPPTIRDTLGPSPTYSILTDPPDDACAEFLQAQQELFFAFIEDDAVVGEVYEYLRDRLNLLFLTDPESPEVLAIGEALLYLEFATDPGERLTIDIVDNLLQIMRGAWFDEEGAAGDGDQPELNAECEAFLRELEVALAERVGPFSTVGDAVRDLLIERLANAPYVDDSFAAVIYLMLIDAPLDDESIALILSIARRAWQAENIEVPVSEVDAAACEAFIAALNDSLQDLLQDGATLAELRQFLLDELAIAPLGSPYRAVLLKLLARVSFLARVAPDLVITPAFLDELLAVAASAWSLYVMEAADGADGTAGGEDGVPNVTPTLAEAGPPPPTAATATPTVPPPPSPECQQFIEQERGLLSQAVNEGQTIGEALQFKQRDLGNFPPGTPFHLATQAMIGVLQALDGQAPLTMDVVEAMLQAAEAGCAAADSPPPDDDGCSATVNQNANLRGGPGTNFDVVGSAPAGSTFPATGRNNASDWINLQTPNGPAWIAGFLVTLSCDVQTLPVSN